MKVVVGLGNPGPEYALTRHNLGYQVISRLAELLHIALTKRSHNSLWGQGRLNGEVLVLAQPLTFMNLSGLAVEALLHHWGLTPEALVVIHDDLDVPLGRLKLTARGGAGGHRGIQSIIGALGSEKFFRVKMGIGRPPAGTPAEEYVLSPFLPEEQETIAALVEKAAQAVVILATAGLGEAQARFHRHAD